MDLIIIIAMLIGGLTLSNGVIQDNKPCIEQIYEEEQNQDSLEKISFDEETTTQEFLGSFHDEAPTLCPDVCIEKEMATKKVIVNIVDENNQGTTATVNINGEDTIVDTSYLYEVEYEYPNEPPFTVFCDEAINQTAMSSIDEDGNICAEYTFIMKK